jgi:hypothetical protein
MNDDDMRRDNFLVALLARQCGRVVILAPEIEAHYLAEHAVLTSDIENGYLLELTTRADAEKRLKAAKTLS